jgi:hypothetical protein
MYLATITSFSYIIQFILCLLVKTDIGKLECNQFVILSLPLVVDLLLYKLNDLIYSLIEGKGKYCYDKNVRFFQETKNQ